MKRTITIHQCKNLWLMCICLLTLGVGCKKFIEIEPPTSAITSDAAYANDGSAAAVLTSIYIQMNQNSKLSAGSSSISNLCGLSADELKEYSSDPVRLAVYSNNLNASTFTNFWSELYEQLYVANAAIEGITSSQGISDPVRRQLVGEAKFIRSFLLFYATSLYGGVPIVTHTDYRNNNIISRNSQHDVFRQIIEDLKEAQANLAEDYWAPNNIATTERVRPNKAVATALLARAYLYMTAWEQAEIEASAIIDGSIIGYQLENDLDKVFLKNSAEAIWQLQSVYPGINTFDAYAFVLTSPPGTGIASVALDQDLLRAFETNDNRYFKWIGNLIAGQDTFYYPNKYKINVEDVNIPVTEYTTVLRLAEQYLIRAEARAEQGKLEGAKEDLNVIRQRAGLPETTANDKGSLLAAIQHERRIELFTEWGHRWFDLKRTGKIDEVMNIATLRKGGTWSSYKQLLPIPQNEVINNPNIVQNAGYN